MSYKSKEWQDCLLVLADGVKRVYTRDFKGSEYQRFGKGVDPGRPEEAYEVCLTRREPSLGVVVMIYELI